MQPTTHQKPTNQPTTNQTNHKLTNQEIQRYARHITLPEVGINGQQKIRNTSILCIGAGGLGSPIALYLAAAGIGKIGIIDHDTVDHSNLQRQILHGTNDIGKPKTQSAQQTLQQINPHTQIQLHNQPLTSKNALETLAPYDIILDGTDNFPTRYLTNDASYLLNKPNIYGSIYRFEGQASIFHPQQNTPCYRCLYPEPPPPGLVPSCAEGGVLGVLPGIIGTIQATETIKLILNQGKPLLNRLLLYNALNMTFRELKLRPDPQCPLCGKNPTITQLIDYQQFCGIPKNDNNNQPNPDETTVDEMKKALDNPALNIQIIDVREPHEHQIAHIPGIPQIPLSQLPQRHTELNPNQTYYLHCKSGVRSMKALTLLKQHGFKNLKSVKGGINAWSQQIDPTIPQY